jgi:hypothetical protein
MKVAPDDPVYQVNAVWLGPAQGGSAVTFPWTARYIAYGVWLALFLLILLVEAVTPLSVHIPPIWEICIATLATYAVLGYINHERPIVSLWQTLLAEVRAPRPTKTTATVVADRSTMPSRARPQLYTRSHL